ncbi:pyridoxamine 5'-phosphate oxidase [Edaphobacter dinghuensis]|uniref:Pyridoxamine 5'-phosphate oxidase n=1 Tax=Edaphobacter dinghuensis TaxID=1560005 RepID=A0A917HK77_9BACT|nr:pyridoxamine 5'-phosphate oxidase [Edaphobacter dinghuensis]GGG80853.1 pyridoxine/pyridoxamine 5'-phosphate oxidase [Edaphobacter dinghuensis]
MNMIDAETAAEPIALFRAWMHEAEAKEPNDPNAAALATATVDGAPSVRMVLLKGLDERGFAFYTNAESRKGVELAANPRAAMCFHWKSLRRQVRVEGLVSELPETEADAYFHSRSRGSQLGAVASRQSRPLAGRQALEERVRAVEERCPDDVSRPDFWRGYVLWPERIEFWINGADRLHDRFLFSRVDSVWVKERLYP